jgi:hypothetical protein
VNPVGILEVTSVIEKLKGKVIGPVGLRFKVPMAEHGSIIKSPITALATSGREIEAAMVAGSLFSGCRLHFLSLRRGVPTPGIFWQKSAETVQNKEARVRNMAESLEVHEKAGLGGLRLKILII